MNTSFALNQLGWQSFFQQQLSLDDLEQTLCGRVIAHHRSEFVIQLEQSQIKLPITPSLPSMTVGDWVLVDHQHSFIRLLERKSSLSRKASGSKVLEQWIAANIDTIFIVCSLNQDFNLSRIERYLAIAHEAQIEPVVVLTKRDLCEDWQHYVNQVQKLDPLLAVEAINALDQSNVQQLQAWCTAGKTLSFLGSSGVGKSSLVNTLLGVQLQQTGVIREDDSKGKHTTTSRSIHFMDNGCVLLDTPGMRELQLADCESGVSQTFADIEALTQQCRFANCQHQSEPGCAIQQALSNGTLELRRLTNYNKLLTEQARNAASLNEKRAKDKALSKMYRQVQTGARHQKKGY